MNESGSTHRIVVADDEADIRRLIAFTLRRRGFEVVEAESGDAALALIAAEPPALVVLDVMMPGLTGHEVARSLAGNPATARIPILMVSAKGQASEVEAGLASGAAAYIVKPFAPRDLAERVTALLAGAETGAAGIDAG
jgi:DNA-binding response OmpR family regulator